MPVMPNLASCANLWAEQDINLYNKMPFFIDANVAKYMNTWSVWDKLTGTRPWRPNEGTILKGVRVEPTPIVRQFPTPVAYTGVPKKDVFEQRETVEQETLYRHRFESQLINWIPSFVDWRRDQVGSAIKDIAKQIANYNDTFLMAHIWAKSPFVYVSGRAAGELVQAPMGLLNEDNTAANSKNNNWVQQMVADIPPVNSGNGILGLTQINKAGTILREDIQAPFWEGANNMPTDGKGLAGKYCLVGSTEAFSQLVFDPYLQVWKPLDLNTANDGFTGNLFGFITYKFIKHPVRFLIGSGGTITAPAPETWQANPDAYDYGNTIPNPDYVNAQIEVAFLVGAEPYKSIRVGPPPKEFASGRMSESKYNRMEWNGQVKVTDNILHTCADQDGNPVQDTNKYGEYLQLISQVILGELPVNRRYVLPILYRRHRVATV